MTTILHLGALTVFDGEEPHDLRTPLAAPHVHGLSLADLTDAPLARIDDELGAGSVDALAALAPVREGQLDRRRYVDDQRLQLFRAYRPLEGGRRVLLVTSFGEFQPGRYVAVLHAALELGVGPVVWPTAAPRGGAGPGRAAPVTHAALGSPAATSSSDWKAIVILAVVGLFVGGLVVKSNLDVFAPGVLGLDPASGDCTVTSALVTNTEHTQNRKRTQDHYYVEYRVGGPAGTEPTREKVEASVYHRAAIGQPIEVCVGKDDPTETVIVGNEAHGTSRTVVLATDAVLAAAALWALVAKLRRKPA